MFSRLFGALCILFIFFLMCAFECFFSVFIYIFGLLALFEFININKKYPLYIYIVSVIAFSFLVFFNIFNQSLSINYNIFAFIFLILLIPVVFNYGRDLYNIGDAFYIISGVLFLGIAFSELIVIHNINIYIFIYVFLIGFICDASSYIIGTFFGKHLMFASLSPNKTFEGMFGGLLFGTLVPIIYYVCVFLSCNIIYISFITLFLCLLGVFGDLCFSAIKRYYHKKDFSKIIPGHGGILDRFDSIIFIVMGVVLLINYIGG